MFGVAEDAITLRLQMLCLHVLLEQMEALQVLLLHRRVRPQHLEVELDRLDPAFADLCNAAVFLSATLSRFQMASSLNHLTWAAVGTITSLDTQRSELEATVASSSTTTNAATCSSSASSSTGTTSPSGPFLPAPH